MPKKHLHITFILPFVNLTGGIKILFEHANRLVGQGHCVTIVYPGVLFHGNDYQTENHSLKWQYFDAPLRQIKYAFFVSLLHKTEANWFPLDEEVRLIRTPDLSAAYIPNADIVIAANPETAEWVQTYPQEKGTKVFFTQDYDIWAWPQERVDRVYTYDMRLITIGSWQKELYKVKFNRSVDMVIPDGVDTKRFTANGKTYEDRKPLRVLMSYHHLAYKGIADGLEAIEIVRKAGIAVQIVMFGVHDLKPDIPKDVEYHQNIPEDDLPALYRSCDIFLWPTHREGFGLPPMEAMASGIPVVGTDAGAMRDYAVDGVTGFIIPIKQPKILAEKLLLLAKDAALRETMGKAAAEGMKRWDWDQQTEKLEQYLLGLVPISSKSR